MGLAHILLNIVFKLYIIESGDYDMNVGSLKIVLGEENISSSSLYRSIGRLYGSDPSSRSLIDKAIIRPIPGHDKNNAKLYSYGMRSRKSDKWSNSKKNDTKNIHSSSSITQGTDSSSSSSYYDRTKNKLFNKPIHIRTSSSYMENEIQDRRKGKR